MLLLDDSKLGARGQNAVLGAALLAQSRGDEGVGIKTRRMAEHERGLEGQGETLAQPTCLRRSLERIGCGLLQQSEGALHVPIEYRGSAGGAAELVGESLRGLGVAAEGPKHVEGDDVA